ncbi:MAG: GNAT family N-acetyltransferase [Actinobacteria bacterium]|nr:GNAT family N-acetyltransferase [Actinomycetota bacterium]
MPDHVVTIRPFTHDDAHAVLELNNINVPELNALDLPEVLRLAAMAEAALVAEVALADNDGVVLPEFAGFCWVIGPRQPYASLNYGWFSRQYDEFVYLDRIAVHSTYRRLGIGRSFYSAIVDLFVESRPVLLCEVNVRPRNESSLRFHHSIGFREVGQQETDGGTKTVSLLELALTDR